MRAGDRATEFRQRCRQLGIKGVTLHSYRYAWAERAKAVRLPGTLRPGGAGNSKTMHREGFDETSTPLGIRGTGSAEESSPAKFERPKLSDPARGTRGLHPESNGRAGVNSLGRTIRLMIKALRGAGSGVPSSLRRIQFRAIPMLL